jgi:hypothetical protein
MPHPAHSRKEDMSSFGRLTVLKQDDGDMCVHVHGRDSLGEPCTATVEFCEMGSGGGRSPETLKALQALAAAIERDNALRPIT